MRREDLWQRYIMRNFPRLHAWRLAQRWTTQFKTPLGRIVKLPKDKYDENGIPQLPSIIAGIAQAFESDALRIVIAHAAERLEGTGAEIVIPLHDEVVLLVPEEHVEEAKTRLKALMLDALNFVCNALPAGTTCPVSADVVGPRRTWGEEDE